MNKSLKLIELIESLVIANAAAMDAVRAVKRSHISIFTAIQDAATKRGVPYDQVEQQLLKLYPEYAGDIAMGKNK